MNLDRTLSAYTRARLAFPSGLIVDASLATDDRARTEGYAHRRIGPPYGTGMLFVFPSVGLVPFTMAETRFALDLVFLRLQELQLPKMLVRVVGRSLGQPGALEPIYSPVPFDLCLETTAWSALGVERDGLLQVHLQR